MTRKSFFKQMLIGLMLLSLLFAQVLLPGTGVTAAADAVDFGLIGFAALNGGTTGGTGGKEVTITSMSQANDLLNTRKKAGDTSPLILKIADKISGSGKIDIKQVKNITVIGVGTRGELEGIGLNIVNSDNIIIRNLKIHHTLAPVDGIGIESSTHIWIDHCEIYNMIGDCNGDGIVDTKGDIEGGDVDYYDGLLDVKKSSEYITVSWNYFHDAFKTSLIGSSDSDTYDRKITFHHNYYYNCQSRTPSYRGGTGHMFNNYYKDIWGSGINSRMGAKLRIENNVFENVGSGAVDSTHKIAEGPIGSYYSDEIGYWDVRDNQFINCKGNQPTVSTCSFTPPYSYSPQPVASVKATVLQYAGIGKIDSGSGCTVSGYVSTEYAASSSNTLLKAGFKVEIQGAGSTLTDENGYFLLSNVAAHSNYTVKISKAGYLSREIKNVNVNGNIGLGSLSSPVIMRAGDTNGDNVINISDIMQIATAFNTSKGNPKYVADYDFNKDDAVNIHDIISAAAYFNKSSADYPAVTVIVISPLPSQSPSIVPSPTMSSVPSPTPADGDIILEPNGSMTLEQAITSIKPGKTIYLKGGTYKFSKTIVIAEGNNGTYGSGMKAVVAYGNEKPVLDFSAMSENSSNRGIVLAGNFWHFKGITIQKAGDNGMLLAGNNNKIEGCLFTKNCDSGLQISRYNSSYTTIDKWPSNNLIVDCTSTENMDSGRENADGFAAKLTCGTGNVFRNCKALYNCDDGWDLYTKADTGAIGPVTLENCEATGNGKFINGGVTGGDGNGYKLGDDTASVAHVLKNCVANNNYANGFTGNGNPAAIILQNCSGTGNGKKLFDRLENAIIS